MPCATKVQQTAIMPSGKRQKQHLFCLYKGTVFVVFSTALHIVSAKVIPISNTFPLGDIYYNIASFFRMKCNNERSFSCIFPDI
jgi:hypothetical protein